MTKEQWELYKDFCEFAKLQDDSNAELPNVKTSISMYMDGTFTETSKKPSGYLP